MPYNTPLIQSGSLGGATTFTVPATFSRRQLLVENADATLAFTVRINDSLDFGLLNPGLWTLAAGNRMGIVIDGGIIKVVLTPVAGNPLYQILVA